VPFGTLRGNHGEALVYNDLNFGDLKGEYIIVTETMEEFHLN
jgi:hypothetical protein